ncbi:sigma-70 family RNA polymerase sigma factor [Thermodesulfobacteriota bacterium]
MKNPETWVDEYGDQLYQFAFTRVHDSEIAADLVQETFLAGLKSKDRFEGRSSMRTWLTGILKHKIIDHLRKKNREYPVTDIELYVDTLGEFFDKSGHWKTGPAKWIANPSKLYEQQEFLEIFYQCLSGLTSRLADAFKLREIDGLSTDEICKVLSITATNLWVLLHRARMKLRGCLERNWFEKEVMKEQ